MRRGGLPLLVLLTALVTLIPLAGCHSGFPVAVDEPVTITFWHSQEGQVTQALLAAMAADFSLAEPNITVELVYRGRPSELTAELQGAVSSQQGPVVAEVNEQDLAVLRAVGVIRPLQGHFSDPLCGLSAADLDDFWPRFVKANTTGRQVWGLPWSHKIYALVCGLPRVSSPPTTWEELMETASALTQRDPNPARSTYGLAFRPDTALFTILLHQNGGQLVAGDLPRVAFNSPEGAACLEYLYEMTVLRKAALLTMADPVEAVISGQAAMAVCRVGWTTPPPTGSVVLAALPAGVARATLAPGTSLVLAAGRTPVEEEAGWRFIRWLSSATNATRWAAATGDVPTRQSVMSQSAWRLGPGSTPGWWTVMGQMDSALILPWAPGLNRIDSELTPGLSDYLLGQISSPRAMLDQAVERINRSATGP